MEESEGLLSGQQKYKFEYSLFLKILFWVVSPMMLLLPSYDFYRGTMDYAENEHIAAFFIILFGFVCLHIAWRCLGSVTMSAKGITHTRLGMRTDIDFENIIEIKNRPFLMSLKIVGVKGAIYIEKQIDDYSLAYELLREKVPDKLEPSGDIPLMLPLVTKTAINHYYFLMLLSTGAAVAIVWQIWQVYGTGQQEFDMTVMLLAAAALIFSLVFTVVMHLKVEFTEKGIGVSGLWHQTKIPREHITHLGLERQYEDESDPAYDINIEYIDMPIEEAPEEVTVHTQTISGSLLDMPLEPIFDLVVREFKFDEGEQAD